jgi:cytochrome c oxidase subunit 2
VRKYKPFVHVALIAVALGAITAIVAYFGNWLPAPSSREAGRIWFIFWISTITSVVIFAIVMAAILYSAYKFRRQPDDDTDGPAVHGHTKLEIVWTVIPTIIVVLLSVASAIVLHKNSDAGKNPLKVGVVTQQYAFAFTYPNGVQTATLRLPLNRHTELHLTSLDVIHAFWVPEFGQKQDMVPGQTFRLVITPDRLGTYPVICTHLCGLGHAVMRTSAIVMPAADFDKWIADQKAALAGPPGEAGKTVFTNGGCAACHAFTPAGAKGAVGPDLDKLAATAKAAGVPVEDYIRESIVEPNKVIAKGYPANVMPQTFGDLPKDQLDALVSYLAAGQKEGS